MFSPTPRPPAPKATPPGICSSPWMTMLEAVGLSPLVTNCSVSELTLATPTAISVAPPVFEELLHPCPGPAGGFGFPQGQTMVLPVPGSQIVVAPPGGGPKVE